MDAPTVGVVSSQSRLNVKVIVVLNSCFLLPCLPAVSRRLIAGVIIIAGEVAQGLLHLHHSDKIYDTYLCVQCGALRAAMASIYLSHWLRAEQGLARFESVHLSPSTPGAEIGILDPNVDQSTV